MLRKSILIGIFALSTYSQVTKAKIIELNNQNPDLCRQQLLQAQDDMPLVLVYKKSCFWAKKLIPIYEQVSDELSDRTFFTYDFLDGENDDYLNAKTAHDCLGVIPIASPSVFMFYVPQAKPRMILGQIKQGLDGGSTREDIYRFADTKLMTRASFKVKPVYK